MKDIPVDQESISVSSSYTTSINGHIASTGRNEFMERGEKTKMMRVTF